VEAFAAWQLGWVGVEMIHEILDDLTRVLVFVEVKLSADLLFV
jgi:hypothetical protein